jgi:flagellar basal body-associated protein FliL
MGSTNPGKEGFMMFSTMCSPESLEPIVIVAIFIFILSGMGVMAWQVWHERKEVNHGKKV